MRLLVYPLISTKNEIWRESNFIVYWQLAKALPDVFFYMLVNKEAVIPEDLQLPNLTLIRANKWMPFQASQALIDSAIYEFNALNGPHQVDAIVVSHSVSAAFVKRALWAFSECYVPVFVLEPKAADFGDTHDDILPIHLLLKSASYSECPTFFSTVREKKIALTAAQRYLSASQVKQMDERAVVRSQGFMAKEIYSTRLDKFPDFTLLFAARFNSNKQWDKVLGVFERFCQIHPDAKAIAISPSTPPGGKAKFFQKTEIFEALPRKEYLDKIIRAHVSVSMSMEEGFAIGWAEQIATGKPVLLPDRAWARTLMPHNEYTLFYKTENELYALLEYVKQQYDAVVDKIQPAVKKFIEQHDIRGAADDIVRYIEKHLVGTYVVFGGMSRQLRDILKKMPDTFTLTEFVKLANQSGMIFGSGYRQVNSLATYRSLYFWLKNNTVLAGEKFKNDSNTPFA